MGSKERDTLYGQSFPYSDDRTVVELFEAQASTGPARPALVNGDVTISYGELDRCAAVLAEALRDRGVRNGDFVPLVMDGGMTLPVAMIAAMKAGSPFVPIDSAWPEERIRVILAQLRPPLVVTAGPGGYRPPGIQRLDVDLGQLAAAPARQARAAWPRPTPGDLMYGFFTSGSTGTPKCALNWHRGLMNRFQYMTRRFGSDGLAVLQNSHHVFDSSIWQLLWPLTMGSRVVIPDRRGILDLERTLEIIARHRVTMTDFVPSVFNTMTTMLAADPRLARHLTGMRRILIGGEEVDGAAVRALCRLVPGLRVTNTYGPTEASIGSVFHDITDADGDRVPLGRPIDNTYVVILNDGHEPVPTGQVGEICIGGDCLGAGYLGDQQKTAVAFIPNPVPQIPGRRLYRTGDLGYERPDGLLMFVGRADDQVKVGGVRIELAEVGLALSKHPQVRQAAVIVHADTLTAFVAADPGVTTTALAEHARALLPGSLVPRRFILLDRLPLTPNGKLDRRELARLARHGGPSSGAGSAERPPAGSPGGIEEAVRRIWLELLARDDMGMTQSLFEAGGDSLTAQRLALAIRRRFGVPVSIRDVMSAPTIRDQADLIARQPGGTVLHPRPAAAMVSVVPAVLRDDIRLPEDIVRPDGQSPAVRPARFLLTGATGFIGGHLLHELAARRPDATIYCLVRAGDAYEARARLADTLRQFRLPVSALRNAIAIPGDLGRPRFGLDQADFERLAGSVDAVLHNGALVNLLLDYSSHRPANVAGTTEILRFAALGPAKQLHYVSTLSVFGQPAPGEEPVGAAPVGEAPVGEQDVGDGAVPGDGYSQSKWVAEKILALARSRGIPSAVYRLGEVMPRSDGLANPRSVLDHLLRACVRTGLRFATPAVTDWTPVDTVSRFIAGAVADGQMHGCYHVLWPSSVQVAEVMRTLAGSGPLREVPYPEFWASLDQAAQDGADRDLLGLLSVLPHPQDCPAPEHLTGIFSDAAAKFQATRAARLAAELGVAWPAELNDGTIARYCRTLRVAVTESGGQLTPLAGRMDSGCS
jgi:amino acid adenylation domain-containing protein/thioester reductase-like protein